MLKVRVIPILTFNGFALVKTKQFSSPRMVGNPVQAAKVYNSRRVDELVFIDIMASRQNRKINSKIVKDVIKECYMPVTIGGGIDTIDDINNLLKMGADKVLIKNKAISDPFFIKHSSEFFGAQCISIAVDVFRQNGDYLIFNHSDKILPLNEFINTVSEMGAGELIVNSVDLDGTMKGYDIDLYNEVSVLTNLPIVMAGGAGDVGHFTELFTHTDCDSVAASSIFHFTQFTPHDIKLELQKIGKPVRF